MHIFMLCREKNWCILLKNLLYHSLFQQYLKGVVSTNEYIDTLSQNVKGVRETLTNFLELYIYSVRKDIRDKKLTIEECVPFRLVKAESLPMVMSQASTARIYTPPPIATTTAGPSSMQMVRMHPMSVPPQSSSSSLSAAGSPAVTVSASNGFSRIQSDSNLLHYSTGGGGGGSSGQASPISQTGSPQFHFVQQQQNHGNMEIQKTGVFSPQTVPQESPPQRLSPIAPAPVNPSSEVPMETETYYFSPPQYQVSGSSPHSYSQEVDQPGSSSQVVPEQPGPTFQINEPPPSLPEGTDTDSTLINADVFETYLRNKHPGFTIETPAFLALSEYLEVKLRKVMEDAIAASEHRTQQFRNDSNYIQLENPRLQLKFLDKMEQLERQRKIDAGKEVMSQGNKNISDSIKANGVS